MTQQTTQTPGPDRDSQTPRTWWQRFTAGLPTGLSLALIGLVWLAGAVWSFEEQSLFAQSRGFRTPELLPLVLDGMAVAMAAVAYAASLDARPAVFARLGTALAILCSAASNGTWAWARSGGDVETITLAAGVPVVAAIAFEVLLSEVRRQVLRRRGQPGPVAITYPRLVRLVLAPWSTITVWRREVLRVTDPARAFQTPAGPDQPRRTPPTPPRPAVEPTSPADRPAIEATPHQTPVPDPAPDPRADLVPVVRQTSARRPVAVRPPVPTAVVRLDRTGNKDRADLAALRRWQARNGGQTPSISQTQQIVGGGRSRAVRLRGLLTADQTTDPDRAAV
ncbi:DUF2637 domain-containing protein [Micromonospora sp. HM5-17]|uniref:DUF2637 domain-containing protein n=1 Tax=Micromonospora sp. HM5-17 TaxID=2487710 RepID=UPI000F46DD06|nr:DUF2637 domain-containing protein [Micromonospora sp. HM5-17]ROT29642.1 DUF2637 domain-containing protein [Micromonospora sp. HM5-17]